MKILLVEDERKVASFIVKGLQEEFYSVDHSENGADALKNLQIYDYDLVITDIMMPGMDGFDFIKKVRSQGNSIPILVLTARDNTRDKVLGLDIGADDYLTKPFVFSELLARVRALLRRKSSVIDELRVADLILEPLTHGVKRAGKSIELTPKEYALLEFLIRNKNRVITRTSIIEHVWNMHFDSDTNLVDVFISYLRRKIEDGFDSRIIYSVRGVGYIVKDQPEDK